MRVSIDKWGSGIVPFGSQRFKTSDQRKVPEAVSNGTGLGCEGLSVSQGSLQAVNNALLRLIQTINRIFNPEPGPELAPSVTGFNEEVKALVEGLNEVLQSISDAGSDNSGTDKGTSLANVYLCKVRGVIASSLETGKVEDGIPDAPVMVIELVDNGSVRRNSRELTESTGADGRGVGQAIKAVASTLVENLPLCIDPNSGNMLYVPREAERRDDDEASKALASLRDELDKERTVLEKQLNTANLLIAHCNGFVHVLKLKVGSLDEDE